MSVVPSQITSDVVAAKLRGERSDVSGAAFRYLLLACLGIVLAALVALIASVSGEGIPFLADRGLNSFLRRPSYSDPAYAGVYQALVGTVTSAVIVALIAFPLGVAAAVYLEEYAHDTMFTRAVSVVIRNLAGVPAVVFGLLGAAIFVTGPLKGLTGGASILSAGLTLAVLVLPIVVITSSEALRAVPQSLREGGFGAGATRWEVIRSLVLPNAFPGILTGTILALARALGEAAPLILIGAKSSFSGGDWGDLRGDFTALPNLINSWAKLPEAQGWVPAQQAAIIVTLVVILGINAVGIILRNRFEKKSR